MIIRESEFDKLMGTLDKIQIEGKYIPSEVDLYDFIIRNPEKYALFLLWYSEHHPEPQTDEERKILKRINKITNKVIQIIE